MKKVSSKQKIRAHRIRQKRERRKTSRTEIHKLVQSSAWIRHTSREVVDALLNNQRTKIVARRGVLGRAPEVFSLTSAPEETLKFLDGMRRDLLEAKAKYAGIKRPKTKRPIVDGYFDMSTIREITTSTALIVAAEHDRAKRSATQAIPLIKIDDWTPEVVQKLKDIGFFKSLGIQDSSLPNSINDDDDVITVEFYSGHDTRELQLADKKFYDLAAHIGVGFDEPTELSLAISSAISEAMTNVRMHAYVDWHDFEFPHVHKWWMSGAASRSRNEIVISMYDQGATIPVTYPHLELPDAISSYVLELKDRLGFGSRHEFSDDGVLISAAAKYGRSQTGESHRGKGLPQMREAIDICGGGRLMIASRGGRYIYEPKNVEVIDSYRYSVGGTLIEWTLRLEPDDA